MISNDTIDKAIAETLTYHPDYCKAYGATINECIIEGINFRYFTNKNGARQSLRGLTADNLLKYILEEAVTIYSAMTELYPQIVQNGKIGYHDYQQLQNNFPNWKIIRDEVEKMNQTKSNLFNLYRLNPNHLFSLVDAVINIRFNSNFYPLYKQGEKFFDAIYTGQQFRRKISDLSIRNRTYDNLYDKINADYQTVKNISNVNINFHSVNRCLVEVLDGSQIKHNHREYALDGELFATQDIGLRRNNQEDSTIIMTHPQNPAFKLIAVADGMGGGEYGEKASNFTIAALSDWFQGLPLSYYEDYELLYPALRQEVQKISDQLYYQYSRTNKTVGSTLVGAIVGRDVTTIVNVGDSRAYAYANNSLNLITEDESLVWSNMQNRVKQEKRNITYRDINNLRFDPNNNQISRAIGMPSLPTPQIRLIPNNEYETLLLFSDGVHDLLSTEDIKVIAQTTSPKDLTNTIVNAALNKNAVAYDEYGRKIEISAGKDNTTAAAYVRR